ncbi:ABC transporter ATP-binding protein [Pacificispira sp.]|uniref:ABC transporter ATP-binding protein n=1 Tax=Pacificispira sp. TaxID=2888761 RepID=UPI003BABFC9E
MKGLEARNLSVALAGRAILQNVDLTIPEGGVTAIIGPNGCGKSTLLRTFAHILRPSSGTVLLDGRDIAQVPPRDRARRIGFLPQSPQTPEGIRVRSLVTRGRTPHQGRFGLLSRGDHAAVDRAIALVGLQDLADRRVDRLSGGQRQRAWIALTLAQETSILLLDEPTTYLDPPHQVEVLRLARQLNADLGITVVMVLHDITLASLYADCVIGMKNGHPEFATRPGEPLQADQIRNLFEMDVHVLAHPTSDRAVIVPVQ